MVIQYSTLAFEAMLTNSFTTSNESDFHYLCDNIRFVQLRSFMLNDGEIINATCIRGGPEAQIAPESFTPIASPNDTAVAAYKDTSSKLFAHNYAATASSPAQLKEFCNRASDYSPNLEALQLDPKTVSNEICSMQSVPAAPQTQAKIMELSSDQFVVVVENMSNVPGWKKWLCDTLDKDSMDGVGLDGAKVLSQICGDVKESS